MLEVKKQTLSETFSVYFDKRMLRILLLGAISGFPWVLIASSLSLWLKEEGLSRSTIGPSANFASLPEISKWILSLGMILGRLELFAILVLFLPSFWRNYL